MAHYFIYRAKPGCWVAGDRTFGPFAAVATWGEALESIEASASNGGDIWQEDREDNPND